MNKHQAFVTCVQTAVLTRAARTWEALDGVLHITGMAIALPEEHVPADYAKAAGEFIRWHLGVAARPAFVAAWQEDCRIERPMPAVALFAPTVAPTPGG